MIKHATVYRSLCLVAAALTWEPLAGAAPRQASVPPPHLEERVAAMVKSEILAKGVPSVSVAVMRDGKMLMEGAWGRADVGKNRDASTSGVYPIGSVSIEQLLNHTSGVPREVRQPDRRFESLSSEALLQMAAGAKLDTKPGTAFGYSNGPPPGMHHSQLLGAGGVCTTAADLVRWRHALHRGRVLSADSYDAMTTPRGAAVSANYGFGLYVRPAPWGDMAIVGGGQALSGHTAELHWYPGHSLAVAVLYNAAPRVPGVADLIPRIVLGVPLPEKSK